MNPGAAIFHYIGCVSWVIEEIGSKAVAFSLNLHQQPHMVAKLISVAALHVQMLTQNISAV